MSAGGGLTSAGATEGGGAEEPGPTRKIGSLLGGAVARVFPNVLLAMCPP